MQLNTALIISLEEGIKYGPLVLSGAIVLRLTKLPDFGFVGAFLVGACALGFSSLQGWSPLFGVPLACLCGGLCGAMTSFLFLTCRLNSLICGIITCLFAYSASFLLTGSSREIAIAPFVPTAHLWAITFAIIVALTLVLSTRYAVAARLAAERPLLVSGIGGNPDLAIWSFMLVGNCLAGFAGAIYGGTAGGVSNSLADDKLFLGLTSLILGESLLKLVLLLPTRLLTWLRRRNAENGIVRAMCRGVSVLSGTDSVWVLLAAVVGNPVYWLIFNYATGLLRLQAHWNKCILAASLTAFLLLTNRLGRGFLVFSGWSFHEQKSW